MAGVKISLTAPASAAEVLSEGMLELGAQSVSLRSAHSGGEEVLEPPPKSMPLWHRVSVTGLFPLTVDVAQVATELEGGEGIEIDWLQQRDWSQTWRAPAPTLSFGERLMVMPRGAPPPKGFPGAVLRSDPGLAFGSGAHPTTHLCLSWLAEADLAGAAVLDYGCGAGILGIAAALLGANQVIAVDQDPQALIATKRNARHNNVTLDAVQPPARRSESRQVRRRHRQYPGQSVGRLGAPPHQCAAAKRPSGAVGCTGEPSRGGRRRLSSGQLHPADPRGRLGSPCRRTASMSRRAGMDTGKGIIRCAPSVRNGRFGR